jgi:hypothetical protein
MILNIAQKEFAVSEQNSKDSLLFMIVIFWVMAPFRFVGGCQHLGGTF